MLIAQRRVCHRLSLQPPTIAPAKQGLNADVLGWVLGQRIIGLEKVTPIEVDVRLRHDIFKLQVATTARWCDIDRLTIGMLLSYALFRRWRNSYFWSLRRLYLKTGLQTRKKPAGKTLISVQRFPADWQLHVW
jgi:hypothetical protein